MTSAKYLLLIHIGLASIKCICMGASIDSPLIQNMGCGTLYLMQMISNRSQNQAMYSTSKEKTNKHNLIQ